MSEYLIQGDTMTAIADAVRAAKGKSGTATSTTFTPSDIVTQINNLPIAHYFKSMTGGSFTNTTGASITSSYTITHNLGYAPHFVYVWTRDYTGQESNFVSSLPAMISVKYINNFSYITNTTNVRRVGWYTFDYIPKSTPYSPYTTTYEVTEDNQSYIITPTTFEVLVRAAMPLPSGITYYWIAGAFE